MSNLCRKCGAKCCKYFCFEIDEPDSFEEFEDIRWYLCHEGISVHVDEGDWYISIGNKCMMLADDDSCHAYDRRPLICRKYAMDNCDHTGGDYGYDEEFTTPEQIDEYARRKLGKKVYRHEKAKALRELEKQSAKQGP